MELTQEHLSILREYRACYAEQCQQKYPQIWQDLVDGGYIEWAILYRHWTKSKKADDLLLEISRKELDATRCPVCNSLFGNPEHPEFRRRD